MKVLLVTLILHEKRDEHGRSAQFDYLLDPNVPFSAERLRAIQAKEAVHPTRDGLRGYGVHAEEIEKGFKALEETDPEFQEKCDNITGGYDNELFYTPGKAGEGVSMTVELIEVY